MFEGTVLRRPHQLFFNFQNQLNRNISNAIFTGDNMECREVNLAKGKDRHASCIPHFMEFCVIALVDRTFVRNRRCVVTVCGHTVGGRLISATPLTGSDDG